MQITLIDFFIGFFLMNAMPHMLFGLFEIRFLSLFGYSSRGNLAYAFLNVAVALLLFHMQYGIQELLSQGILIDALTVFLLYLVTGRFFYKRFQNKYALI